MPPDAPTPERTPHVDVWLRDIGRRAEDYARLCPAEQARESRIGTARRRDQFVAGRALLREVLGNALGVDARSLAIAGADSTKPYLLDVGWMHFSLSHSGDLVVLALAPHIRLGIDTEAMNPARRWPAIAERFFSQSERSFLAAAPPDEQVVAFHRIWTCKEAYLKALGIGLPGPLRTVSVSPAEGRVSTGVSGDDPTRWRLAEIALSARHTTSLCYESDKALAVRIQIHDERR